MLNDLRTALLEALKGLLAIADKAEGASVTRTDIRKFVDVDWFEWSLHLRIGIASALRDVSTEAYAIQAQRDLRNLDSIIRRDIEPLLDRGTQIDRTSVADLAAGIRSLGTSYAPMVDSGPITRSRLPGGGLANLNPAVEAEQWGNWIKLISDVLNRHIAEGSDSSIIDSIRGHIESAEEAREVLLQAVRSASSTQT